MVFGVVTDADSLWFSAVDVAELFACWQLETSKFAASEIPSPQERKRDFVRRIATSCCKLHRLRLQTQSNLPLLVVNLEELQLQSKSGPGGRQSKSKTNSYCKSTGSRP